MTNKYVEAAGLLVLWFSIPTPSRANILGEDFQNSSYGKSDKWTKIEKRDGVGSAGDRTVISSTWIGATGDRKDNIYSVSKKSGKIIGVHSLCFKSIHHALAFAAFVCEGDVSLPSKYSWPDGYVLKCEPSAKYSSARLKVSISVSSISDTFDVKAEISDEAPQGEPQGKRLEELRQMRDEYFKTNGATAK